MGECHTFQVQSLENSLSPSVTSDSATLGIVAHQAPCPWSSPGKNTRMCCHLLLHPWEWVLLYSTLMATFFYQRASMTKHRQQSPRVRAEGTDPRGSQIQTYVALPFNGTFYQLPDCCSHLSSHQSLCASAKWLSWVWVPVIPWAESRQAALSVGTLQARILGWVASSSSRGSSPSQGSNSGLLHYGGFLSSEPPGKPTSNIRRLTISSHSSHCHCFPFSFNEAMVGI